MIGRATYLQAALIYTLSTMTALDSPRCSQQHSNKNHACCASHCYRFFGLYGESCRSSDKSSSFISIVNLFIVSSLKASNILQ